LKNVVKKAYILSTYYSIHIYFLYIFYAEK